MMTRNENPTFDLSNSEIRDLMLEFDYDVEHDSFVFTDNFWNIFNQITEDKVGLSLKNLDEPWRSYPHKTISTVSLVRSMRAHAIPVLIPKLSWTCVRGIHSWTSSNLICTKCGMKMDHRVTKLELFEKVLTQVQRNVAVMSGLEVSHVNQPEMSKIKKVYKKYQDVINFLIRVEVGL